MCESPGDIPGAHGPLKSGAYEATVVRAVVAHAGERPESSASVGISSLSSQANLPHLVVLAIPFIVFDFFAFVLDILVVGVGGRRDEVTAVHDTLRTGRGGCGRLRCRRCSGFCPRCGGVGGPEVAAAAVADPELLGRPGLSGCRIPQLHLIATPLTADLHVGHGGIVPQTPGGRASMVP